MQHAPDAAKRGGAGRHLLPEAAEGREVHEALLAVVHRVLHARDRHPTRRGGVQRAEGAWGVRDPLYARRISCLLSPISKEGGRRALR